MTYQCLACQRSFTAPGFCPYDGKPLQAADKPRAESNAETVDVKTDPNARQVHSYASGNSDQMREALRPQASAYDRLVGETLDGRYFIEKKIGEGGMGVVFSARHAVIERPLAIKVLKREVLRDAATIQRFVQEAKAASRIGHPNIVDVTDFGTTPEGMTYSVMEYVDGITLSKAIKDGAPFPPERAVHIASQIARALGAAHDKGIVHRDLKPENVFLIDREGRTDFVKIVDFGIAKVQPVEGAEAGPRLTRAGAVFGTPEYMAPEQASGRGDTDNRVDIYALGTILYEMCVGSVPHKSDSMVRMLAMQMLDVIPLPSQSHPGLGLPKAVEDIMMKALAKKREDRYATMGEMLKVLDTVRQSLIAAAGATLSISPLPPGADPNLSTALPAAAITNVEGGPPRRKKPATKQLHEPEFVAKGPGSFDHVFDEAPADDSRRTRWPLIFAGLAMLGLGVGASILVLSKLSKDDPPVAGVRGDGSGGARDATQLAELADAAAEPPPDAAVALVPADAGGRPARDAGAGVVIGPTGPHPKTIRVEVLTRPGEAIVYIGPTYRGPSGVMLEEPYGKKRKIECKTERMKGSVDVVFDGSRTSVMCTATRQRFCVSGIKNPFDDCEIDPNAGP